MHVTVVGAQWGDEGKGKVVDWLSHRADCVVRFQGGNNAGHTLVVDGEVYKLSLLPSGVLRSDKKSLIASGVVVDPWVLLKEMEGMRARGLSLEAGSLYICGGASLILPFHLHLDALREVERDAIGTTRRGIGPAYEDRVGRRAIHVRDLLSPSFLAKKVQAAARYHNMLRAGFGAHPVNEQEVLDSLQAVGEKIKSYIGTSWQLIHQWDKEGKKILFEGAQGFWLDVNHGTYPYVTASNTHPCAAAVGSGIGHRMIGTVLGLAKAYTTRVGLGPFPTELDGDIARYLCETGKEFGTVTGRSRRCGWFDAVLTRQAVRMSGIDGLVLTKLDILDGLDDIKICVGYEHGQKRYDHWPYLNEDELEHTPLIPIYETLPGWKQSTRGLRRLEDYPRHARNYMRRIEELLEVPIHLISSSPDREDMVVIQDPFLSSEVV